MLGYRRLNKDDYIHMGRSRIWATNDAAILFACFEMETEGHYGKSMELIKFKKSKRYGGYNDIDGIFWKKYSIYSNKIMHLSIEGKIPCFTFTEIIYPELPRLEVESDFMDSPEFFSRDHLLETVNNDQRFNLDLLKLIDYLKGEGDCPDSDLNSLKADIEKDLAKIRANARWGKRVPMVEKIRSYVVRLLENGCVCDHAQMKDIVWKELANDEVVKFYKPIHKAKGEKDYSKYITKDNLLDICREIYEEKAPDRIYKDTLHKRRKDCPIHSVQ